ncbi:hypothetical protein Q4Q34_18485 [Flavivirga abyssicola]|uniref:hypothetical protein n=1 Tax=Flavivirga abyssicola TaxID=3063533 RepID=UPI0026E0818D|nr:hypothetical protein [Flavivirga sp. MEBiC07777]WVK13204.1 hypothetical protein Q4Q34_18485 [Flavivirga sp. MEBiC07777]
MKKIIPKYFENMILTFLNGVENLDEIEYYISNERAKQILNQRNCLKNKKFVSLSEISISENDLDFLSSIEVFKPSKSCKEVNAYLSQFKDEQVIGVTPIFISYNKNQL